MFRYGSFINAIISFLTVATAIFFFVVVPYNALHGPHAQGAAAGPDDAQVPGVHERDLDRGEALRVLHGQVAPA